MKRFWMLALGTLFFSCDPNAVDEEVDCSITDLSLEVIKVRIADCGLENGEITVEAMGGTPPYQYYTENGSPQESNVFKNIRAKLDPYVLYVTDKNGCTQTTSTFMGQKGPFDSSVAVTPAGCDDVNGAIVATAFNGVPPYKYQLGENGTYQSENYWENLPPGIYSVWIADANDCYAGITEIQIPTGVSYEETVSGIISTNCTLSECHGGSQAPDFREFSNIQANAEKIQTMTKDKTMPVDGSLTEEEIRLIACWVNDGAPEN